MTATLTLEHFGKVTTVERDWSDLVEVYSVPQDSRRIIPVSEISLDHHLLIIEGISHRIIHMLSRSKIPANIGES